MITVEFTHEEVSRKGWPCHNPSFHKVMASPQSLESERDQYLKDFGSKRFSFVRARPPCAALQHPVQRDSIFWREIAERVVEQNPLFGSRYGGLTQKAG